MRLPDALRVFCCSKSVRSSKRWRASDLRVVIMLLALDLSSCGGVVSGGSSGAPKPVGVSGNGTRTGGGEGNIMCNVEIYASNVAVSGGNLILTLESSDSGALIHTTNAYGSGRIQAAVDTYVEARIQFPGNGTDIYNTPAWWILGPNWPAAGEHDIAEGLGTLTVNYHSPSGVHNQGTIPGIWSNAFHVYGCWRKANSAEVYWDGQLVKTYSADDNGQPGELILCVGYGPTHTAAYGTASQVLVDYVRAWQ